MIYIIYGHRNLNMGGAPRSNIISFSLLPLKCIQIMRWLKSLGLHSNNSSVIL